MFAYIYKNKLNMTNLLISGNTSAKEPWCLDDILDTDYTKYNNYTKNQAMIIQEQEWASTIGPCCDDMTYLELLQFNNTYNNF
jgi:hypothetical protein